MMSPIPKGPAPPSPTADVRTTLTLRDVRRQLDLSQPAFAELLGVRHESYRPWETGRRMVPPAVLAKASALSRVVRDHAAPLHVWATHLHIHVRTLRQAARDGRLAVTVGTRTFFGRPLLFASAYAVHTFHTTYYRKTTRWNRPTPPRVASVPPNYDRELVAMRQRLQCSQARLASAIGAANRHVVYQWESRRRMPSPEFWRRIMSLTSLPHVIDPAEPIDPLR